MASGLSAIFASALHLSRLWRPSLPQLVDDGFCAAGAAMAFPPLTLPNSEIIRPHHLPEAEYWTSILPLSNGICKFGLDCRLWHKGRPKNPDAELCGFWFGEPPGCRRGISCPNRHPNDFWSVVSDNENTPMPQGQTDLLSTAISPETASLLLIHFYLEI